MIVSTKTAEEMLEQIHRRMKEHEAALDRLNYAEIDPLDVRIKEVEFHRGCLCELRYMRNIIELRYL